MSETRTLLVGRGECLSLSDSDSSSDSIGAETTGPKGAAPLLLDEKDLKKEV